MFSSSGRSILVTVPELRIQIPTTLDKIILTARAGKPKLMLK